LTAAHADRCTVNAEQVIPQARRLLWGWKTTGVAEPRQGGPGIDGLAIGSGGGRAAGPRRGVPV